jgi:hypothetical protein
MATVKELKSQLEELQAALADSEREVDRQKRATATTQEIPPDAAALLAAVSCGPPRLSCIKTRPLPTSLPAALMQAELVFVRRDATAPPLAPPYAGPYHVLRRCNARPSRPIRLGHYRPNQEKFVTFRFFRSQSPLR